MDRTAAFYSRPSYDFRGGGGFNVFSGSRRQRGGNALGTLKNIFAPVAKVLGPAAVTAGVGLAQDVIRDKMAGKNLKDSFLEHGKARGLDLVKTAASALAGNSMVGKLASMAGLIGKGSRRARRRRKGVRRLRRKKGYSRPRRRQRPPSRKTAPSRKRRKRAKSAPKRQTKRRRVAANF